MSESEKHNPTVRETQSGGGFETRAKKASNHVVHIVAIGASAGGLEPFEMFFDETSVDSGLAFVVIQHLSPDFDSMMDELLSRHSSMDIKRVVDDLPLQPNTIYLNPPRSDMIIKDGRFKLKPQPLAKQLNLPIDTFFTSLAEEYRSEAIAVILSGTGSDGTRGAEAIKSQGGTVLVQNPQSAKFDGMPRSVIRSGNFDAVGTPSELPDLIEKVRKGERIIDTAREVQPEDPYDNIFYRLRDKYGTDFGYYKDATIRRRLERRVQLSGMDIEAYAQRLRFDHDEMDALYSDMLIDVTSFFRDPKAFEALNTHVISVLGEQMTHDNQIRVWVPGCASGEEAYSIAIAFADFAREHKVPLNVKILATDVHQRSLGMAAEGIYGKSNLGGLSEEQIERYFETNVDYYQVKQDLRRLVVFSQHNLLRDPPFTRIDLVTCRNVLIYFKEQAQEKTLALFHFALNVNKFLFLGPSESLNKLEEEFTTVDRRWKIYSKARDVRLLAATSLLPRSTRDAETSPTKPTYMTDRPGSAQRFKKAHGDALEAMLREFAPPGFLLTKSGEVVHVFGSAGNYVQVDGGVFSNRLTDLIHPQLRVAVSTGLDRLTVSDRLDYQRRVLINRSEDEVESIIVQLRALPEINGEATHYLLTLNASDAQDLKHDDKARFLDTSETSTLLQKRIRDLERDLTSTEESLQAMVEELQTSNEELQATNEELMASNEELQSTNEELHSVNEELYTVSAEHQRKIDELTVITDDMNHLLSSTSLGIIFLDNDFNIRRFTEPATLAFNLMRTDLGRPFEHITYRFKTVDVYQAVKDVRASGEAQDHEVNVDDKAFVLRVLPYNTSVEPASGVVITLIDITEIKQAERDRLASKEIFETVVTDMSEALLRLDLKTHKILMCNDAFGAYYNKSSSELIGQKLDNFIDKPMVKSLVTRAKKMSPGDTYKEVITVKDYLGKERVVSRNVRVIGDETGKASVIQSAGQDITDRFRYTSALENLVHIGESASRNFRHVLTKILDIGCQYLNIPIAYVSSVTEDELIVEQNVNGLAQPIDAGTRHVLCDKACTTLTESADLLSIADVSKSKFKGELCYPFEGMKSYIGVGVPTESRAQHFINFCSPNLRKYPFTELEETMVLLLSRMAGFVLDSRDQVEKLKLRGIELENVNERLNRFAYLASHDLQEPLRKIQQSSEVLEVESADALNDESQYFLNIITDAATRMRKLVNDLLLYSSSANQVLKRSEVDLNHLFDAAKSDLNDHIDATHMKFSVENLPKVSCDEGLIRQVFVNIISNCIKYAKDNEPVHLDVGVKHTKDGVVLSFADNGIGINPEHAEQIFDPFTRLHPKDEYEGSGIGLAICKSICDPHGWSISANGNLGQGTIISIEIPTDQILT